MVAENKIIKEFTRDWEVFVFQEGSCQQHLSDDFTLGAGQNLIFIDR